MNSEDLQHCIESVQILFTSTFNQTSSKFLFVAQTLNN